MAVVKVVLGRTVFHGPSGSCTLHKKGTVYNWDTAKYGPVPRWCRPLPPPPDTKDAKPKRAPGPPRTGSSDAPPAVRRRTSARKQKDGDE